MIGQVFHKLWLFEARHANARDFRAVLICDRACENRANAMSIEETYLNTEM